MTSNKQNQDGVSVVTDDGPLSESEAEHGVRAPRPVLAKVMCPQCGQLSGMTRDGLVPEHPPQPGEPGRLCMGSMQNPRNPESDGRPLWNGKANPHFYRNQEA